MRLYELKGWKLRLNLFVLVVSALLLFMSACSKGDDPEPTTIAVSSVKLNKTSVTLDIGETVELTATVSPENATNKTVTWSSSNTSVATVTDGKVTAIAVGSATITAKSNNGLNVTCRIVVVGKGVPPGGSEGTGEEEWKK